MNPILQMLGQAKSTPKMANDPMQMMQQFAQFKNQMRGKDPQAMVMELLGSGKMTQQQFEQLKQQAKMLQNFLR